MLSTMLAALHVFGRGNNEVVAGDGGGLISLIITLVVLGLIFWLVKWALGELKLPEPFAKIINVVLVLIIFIVLLNALLGLGGRNFIAW